MCMTYFFCSCGVKWSDNKHVLCEWRHLGVLLTQLFSSERQCKNTRWLPACTEVKCLQSTAEERKEKAAAVQSTCIYQFLLGGRLLRGVEYHVLPLIRPEE